MLPQRGLFFEAIMKNPSSEKTSEDTIPPAEWAVAGVGLVLLCSCMAFLLYKAFMVEDSIPKITFRVESVIPQDGGALVLAEVANAGGETVTSLQILGRADKEEHQAVIDFLPARSSRKFGMFFNTIPDRDTLKFVPGGYQEP